jgi:hypothetical protein
MRKALGLVAVAAVAVAVWFGQDPVLAEDAAVPNLVGTWIGPLKVLRAKGIGKGTLTIRVTEQDGALFKAEKSWETPGTAGKVGSKEVEKATEPLAGVVDFDGKNVYLAEQSDNGLYAGRLAAPDTLELIYVEAGDGTAYRAQLTRKK